MHLLVVYYEVLGSMFSIKQNPIFTAEGNNYNSVLSCI